MPHKHSKVELFCQNCGTIIYLDENNDWWIDWPHDNLKGYVQFGSKMCLRAKIRGVWKKVDADYVWSVENGMIVHPATLEEIK